MQKRRDDSPPSRLSIVWHRPMHIYIKIMRENSQEVFLKNSLKNLTHKSYSHVVQHLKVK